MVVKETVVAQVQFSSLVLLYNHTHVCNCAYTLAPSIIIMYKVTKNNLTKYFLLQIIKNIFIGGLIGRKALMHKVSFISKFLQNILWPVCLASFIRNHSSLVSQ